MSVVKTLAKSLMVKKLGVNISISVSGPVATVKLSNN